MRSLRGGGKVVAALRCLFRGELPEHDEEFEAAARDAHERVDELDARLASLQERLYVLRRQ